MIAERCSVIKKIKSDPSYIKKGNTGWFSRIWFFGIQRFTISGKKWTLYQLENFIRKEFQEPRIHFALNCSSKSCPILKDGRYSGENLDNELEISTKNFIENPEGVKLEKEKLTINLSMIFKWYNKDFEKKHKTVLNFISKYLEEKDQIWIKENKEKIKINYIPYNWELNITKQ